MEHRLTPKSRRSAIRCRASPSSGITVPRGQPETSGERSCRPATHQDHAAIPSRKPRTQWGPVWTVASGVVTCPEVVHHLVEEERDDALGLAEVIDARAATTNLTSDEVRSLVALTDTLLRKGRFGALALVTENDIGIRHDSYVPDSRRVVADSIFRFSVTLAMPWRGSTPCARTCREVDHDQRPTFSAKTAPRNGTTRRLLALDAQ